MNQTDHYDSYNDEREALKQFAATGDPEAFAYITARYQAMVLGTCNRILTCSADAEDAAQETFLRLARNASSIRSHIGAWLHAAAMGSSIDLIRKAGAQRRAEQRAASPIQAESKPPVETMSWSEIEPVLDEAIAALDEADRELLITRYLCAFSQREIAEQLDLSEGTISRRIASALERLRRQMNKRGLNIATGAVLIGALSTLPALVVPTGLTIALTKVPLFHAASTPFIQAGAASSSTWLKVSALAVGVLLTGTIFIMATKPTGSSVPTIPSTAAVVLAQPVESAPDRPTGKIGPFQIVSAGERNYFDRGVWIRNKRLSINHGIDPESKQVISSSLEILGREQDKDGIILLTRVREIMPVGLKYSRFKRGQLVDIRASFDEHNRIVLEPLTDGVQLGANEPRWFGVRPPAGWEEFGRIPDEQGPDRMFGPWTEAERVPVTITDREIRFGTDKWQIAIYRIVKWEKVGSYARVESIHAGGRDPRLIGTRFRLIIREDEDGYTIAYYPPTKDRSNRWPGKFEYTPENPVTVVTIRGLP
jgi:RNA polymerase sigma factor (sigma-70 family)